MFCKYIGTIKINDLNERLTSLLMKPGALAAYHLEGMDGILHISYKCQIIIYDGIASSTIKSNLIRPAGSDEHFRTIKIKNHRCEPSIDLLTQIQDRLITAVGFDFDLTLTKRHTYLRHEISDEAMRENLANAPEVTQLLTYLKKNKRYMPVIVSNNHKEKIQRYLSLWFTENPFEEVFGREDFHTQGLGDKEVCFYHLARKRLAPVYDEEGFLKLDYLSSCRALDIVEVYMIDDEPMPSFISAGLQVIKAIPDTKSYLIELKYLFDVNTLDFSLANLNSPFEVLAYIKYTLDEICAVEIADQKLASICDRFPILGSRLHVAVRCGNTRLVNYYLEKGDEINKTDIRNRTAAFYAAECRNEAILAAILQHPQFRDDIDSPLLIAVTQMANVKILQCALATKKCNVNACDSLGLAAIHHAAELGLVVAVRLLVAAGGDINLTTQDNVRRTALHKCAIHNKRQVAITLLELKADPLVQDAEGYNPCQLAAMSACTPLLEVLAPHTGDRINDTLFNGRTILTESIFNHHRYRNVPITLIKLAQSKSLYLDLQRADKHGETPLEISNRLQILEIISLLSPAETVREKSIANELDKYQLTLPSNRS